MLLDERIQGKLGLSFSNKKSDDVFEGEVPDSLGILPKEKCHVSTERKAGWW